MVKKRKGKLIIIGGAEDKKNDKEILHKVVKVIDGKLIIITTATKEPEIVGEEYKNIFKKLGIEEIEILNINSRAQVNQPEVIRRTKEAGGFFFTGGDQLRITSILGGSKISQRIRQAYQHGKPVIGTSAGAAIMSEIMIVTGENDEGPKKSSLKLALGLGLIKNIIIDQHFSERGRLGRLLSALAQNPALLGVGIDEDTAIIVNNEEFTVQGSGTVTIIDCSNIISTNVSDLNPDDPLSLTNIKLHVLAKNYSFNLKSKVVIPPE